MQVPSEFEFITCIRIIELVGLLCLLIHVDCVV